MTKQGLLNSLFINASISTGIIWGTSIIAALCKAPEEIFWTTCLSTLVVWICTAVIASNVGGSKEL